MDDEITSINAIYGDETLVASSDDARTWILKLPTVDIALRIAFPEAYPDVSPQVLGPDSVGAALRKGAAQDVVQLAWSILKESFRVGEPCIFELVEELNARQDELKLDSANSTNSANSATDVDTELEAPPTNERGLDDSKWAEDPPWVLSEPVQEKKSVFLARAARVTHPSEAKKFIKHLLAIDKKAAKATHNITAWRMQEPSGVTYQDYDDDGESAAGGRLLHLLQLMDVWNVMVVVSRWYGGVHLGPDRFRIISSVARDAIVKGGFDKNAR